MYPPVYSPARARRLRGLLWATVVLAAILVALGTWVAVVGGSVGAALSLALPGLVVVAAGARTLVLLEERGRPARFGAVVTGLLMLAVGIFLTNPVLGILPALAGVLLLITALIPDVGDQK